MTVFKTNREIERIENKKKSWLLAYAEGSEIYIPNALHVERNDELMLVEHDEEASKEAEKDGIPLIYHMYGVPNGVYVDTEENRRIIVEMLKLYPNYIKRNFISTLSKEELKNIRIEVALSLDEVSFGIETRRYRKKLEKENVYRLIEKFKGNIDDICDYLQDKYKVVMM